MMRTVSNASLLALFSLLFAIPASQVTHESFSPLDVAVRIEGVDGRQTFVTPQSSPLLLEYGLIVRSGLNQWRPVIVDLNGQHRITITSERLYATTSGRLLLPAEAVRAGANELRVAVDDSSSATFELWGRIQNYVGIAPDFPRVFVVADELVAHTARRRGLLVRALRVGVFLVAGLLIAWSVSKTPIGRRPGAARVLALGSASLLPWTLLLYGRFSPHHVWLSIEALAVSVALGVGVVSVTAWAIPHRGVIVRYAAVGLITVALAEGTLRIFHRLRPTFIFYSDPAGRFRGQPGAPHYDTRLNSGGFNDVEHTRERPAHVTYRIAAIGDSFAVGIVPYRGNYLTLLERELAADGSVEVLNMGVSGTGPADYLGLLAKEALAFRPDLVLVTFFVGNDFEVAGRHAYDYSYLATLVRAVWQLSHARVPATATGDAPIVQYREDEPILPREQFLEIEVDRSWIYRTGGDRLIPAAAGAAAHLREMHRAAARAGAELVVVIAPGEVQIAPELQAEVRRASGLASDALDFDLPNRVLAAELAGDQIAVLDLLPAFRREAAGGRLYRVQDTHWNLAGNRLAAAEIAAYLRNRVARGRGRDGRGAPGRP